MKNTFVICLIISLPTGCATLTGISPEYPKDWLPISYSEDEQCPDLTGRYQNFASYSFLPMTGADSLGFRLFGEVTDTQTIVLIDSSATLRIEALNNTGVIGEKVLTKGQGDYFCSEGALVLPTIVHTDADGTGGYRSERRLYLRRGQGGAVIGEERSSGFGAVFWLLPVGGRQTFWFQWHPEK